MSDQATIPDAVTLIGPDGTERRWWALAGNLLAHHEDVPDLPVTVASVTHGTWQLRMLRVDGDQDAHAVRLTGIALPPWPAADVFVTEVDQGLDLCAGEDGPHTEMRILVPWDGRISTARDGERAYLQVDVDDLPAGFPMIVAIRFGPEPPAVPQVHEVPTDADGKPLRIRQTGSSIPEIELAPDGDGHAVSIKWPDRERELFALPAPDTM